jgi:hypothetical protein
MATPKAGKEFQAFCHEHHMEMKLTDVVLQAEGRSTQISAYACPRPECAVHYTPSNGYFLVTKQGQLELDSTPRVRCPHDGQPMYLAELKSQQRNFRLWRCPKCDATRTNDAGLG